MLQERTLAELQIDDEPSFDHVALYSDLKDVLLRAKCRFRVLPKTDAQRWDRALFLNLTFWGANDGGDVLVDEVIPADVVTHVAWHHLAARALGDGTGGPLSAPALFLGEAIASAFDVYLVGRLLGHSPDSTFLAGQVSAMADSAHETGLSAEAFEDLLRGVADDPERAFEDLRQLLFEATSALLLCTGVDDALATLCRFDAHRFAPLLHHYELSNWILYARAYAKREVPSGDRACAVDRALRDSPVALDWLVKNWVEPNLDPG